MALEFAHGSFQWLTTDILNSTKGVTGLGFQPKVIRFYWNGQSFAKPASAPFTQSSGALAAARRGIGFAVGPTSRRCVGTISTNVSAASNTGSVA